MMERTAVGPVPYEFPATPTQSALWFLHQVDPTGTAYHIPLAFSVQGALDVGALSASLAALVERHEILRTVYIERGDTLMQRVLPALPLEWETGPGECPSDDLGALAATCIERPFDLAQAGPLRGRLWSWGEDRHLLVLVIHHVAMDHAAVATFVRELETLYDAFRAGRPSPLPPLPLQFADYAIWTREQDLPRTLAAGLDAWEHALAGHSGVLDLTTPGAARTHGTEADGSRGASLPVALSPTAADALRRFARAERISPFTVLLGAFQTLLHLQSGQRDILVGIPFANRGADERVEQVLGCFINTLPVPVTIDEHQGFAALLQSSRRGLLHAQSFQNVPFDAIVERLRPPREPARNPLYQVGLVLQEPPVPLRLADTTCTDIGAHNGGAMYDLHLWLWESPDGGFAGTATYDAVRFDRADVRALIERWEPLMAALIERPDVPLARFAVSTEEERAQLARWNDTAREWVATESVLDLVVAQGRSTPDAVAATGSAGSLDYAALLAHSESLARALVARGIGRGDLVGINVSRDLGMLVSMLGVMRAGATYVPLDPEYPDDRLAFIARDAGLRALLVDAPDPGHPGQGERAARPRLLPARCPTIALRRDGALDPGDAPTVRGDLPRASTKPADILYVIYTSGSTGRPKGVAVPHRAVINLLRSMQEQPGFDATDRLLAVTTLSFDIAALELLLPLICGGTVVIADPDQVHDGDALAAAIEAHGITAMQATPGIWQLLLESGWRRIPGRRFRALCGGEPLPAALAAALLPRVSELWNLYGPTETTIWSTRELVRPGSPITVGHPIANTTCQVMSRGGQELPPGIAGELCIGGAGVSAGYLHHPELTATRFVDDPGRAGRIFRTGDRAVRARDGRLVCLGRFDDQVKVNGHRVELGEVECVIEEHPMVRQAAVRVSRGEDGDVRLVAYVVTEAGTTVLGSEIRHALRTRLPDYMVPAIVLPISALPLTPNGKRDRAALPDPLSAPRESSFVAPRTEAERAVAGIWCELLGVERVGLLDNFFEIGGHSLLAIRATARVRQRLGVHPDPRALFFQTLEQVAAGLAIAPAQEAAP